MNELTIFNNEEFGEIRMVLLNDEPYFCLSDVCKCLDLNNTSQVKARLDEKGVILNDTLTNGGIQPLNYINEPNLYKVIFQSKKPCAEKFQNWVYKEVLPQIRKTGIYTNIPKSYAEALRMYANEVEQRELIEKQRDEAIRTKAWISDKKTATAMNTASQKVKENEKLKQELDRSKEYATIKKVYINTGIKFKWKPLKDYCKLSKLKTGDVFDQNYGVVKSYPLKAWKDVYNIDVSDF